MSKFILIHGAFHGGWCWEKVRKELSAHSYESVAPDFPGHGEDPSPLSKASFDSYVQRICDVIDQQNEPVILIAHSLGGILATQAAELRSKKILAIIYVAAYLPLDGESLGLLNEKYKGTQVSLLAENMVFSPDFTENTMAPNFPKEVFYGDCSDEDVERARSLIGAELSSVTIACVNTSDNNFGSIPRFYVECLNDKTIQPELQKIMYTESLCKKVYSLESSHSPFLSMPDKLAEILVDVDTNQL